MLLRGLSHLGEKDFSKFTFLPPFGGQNPRNFVSKMGKKLYYSSLLSITRGQKSEIWQECCSGGHLTWVKMIFRNSHFYPLLGYIITFLNLLQKFSIDKFYIYLYFKLGILFYSVHISPFRHISTQITFISRYRKPTSSGVQFCY